LDDLDTLGSYIYDLDETHLEINRQGIEFRQPETDFHVNVKYQKIFGITMSHRAKDTIRLKIIAENIGSYSVNLKVRFNEIREFFGRE
jgi:hypothetical protein